MPKKTIILLCTLVIVYSGFSQQVYQKQYNHKLIDYTLVNKLTSFGTVKTSCGTAAAGACGVSAAGQTTIGGGNNASSWSCLGGILTPGEDNFYAVTVADPAATTLRITLSNVVDNDSMVEVILVGTACNTTTCVNNAQFIVSTGLYSGSAVNYYDFSIAGAGTYYICIDSQGDGVTSFDINSSCATSGVKVDNTNSCDVLDLNNDGLVTKWKGVANPAPIALGDSGQLCMDFYVENNVATGWEWLKFVDLDLGACWINISNPTPNGNNTGFHSNRTCNPSSNGNKGAWTTTGFPGSLPSINWQFAHPRITHATFGCVNWATVYPNWGDGNLLGPPWNCAKFTFCFSGKIDPTCTDPKGGVISLTTTDDGIGATGSSQPSTSLVNDTDIVIDVALLIDFIDIKGYSTEFGNIISWSVFDENNMNKYELFKSKDGKQFFKVSELTAKNNESMNKYFVKDSYVDALNFYKIKQLDNYGKKSFSKIIKIRNSNVRPNILRYVDILGREIVSINNYTGVAIEIFDNGTTRRIIKY